jgi:hypothetical protein
MLISTPCQESAIILLLYLAVIRYISKSVELTHTLKSKLNVN